MLDVLVVIIKFPIQNFTGHLKAPEIVFAVWVIVFVEIAVFADLGKYLLVLLQLGNAAGYE